MSIGKHTAEQLGAMAQKLEAFGISFPAKRLYELSRKFDEGMFDHLTSSADANSVANSDMQIASASIRSASEALGIGG